MNLFTFLLPLLASTARAHPSSERQSFKTTQFISRLDELFPEDSTIYSNETALMETWVSLKEEFNINAQEDALSQRKCADITVVFAKGTTEIGNVGVLTGPAFLDALKTKAGRRTVAMQGVAYAANMTGYLLGGDPHGSLQMAFDIAASAVKCPKTKIVVSGYSQGAQLVHNAAKLLPPLILRKVSSAVTFDDPLNPAQVYGLKGKSLILCTDGDDVCFQGTGMTLAHLSYSTKADEAADFVLAKAKIH
ncbi:cutinase-domain-containing protein [Dactylonectria macrodidyma]|uniref:Cutinase n=1 Tax=Dactylonectria macrodidyma TaxID=307937 RepID=A0A9P9ISN0_9HYPO|nr:cutinase-domain-containing protein [Dactylonectria macrodidyma]